VLEEPQEKCGFRTMVILITIIPVESCTLNRQGMGKERQHGDE
jgi:hypothetical protein